MEESKKKEKEKRRKKKKLILTIMIVSLITVITGLVLVQNFFSGNEPLAEITSLEGQDIESILEPVIFNDNKFAYLNTSKAFMTSTPATLDSSGWVYFNLSLKDYTGDADAMIGVDTEILGIRKIQIYNPQTVYWNTSRFKEFYLVTDVDDKNIVAPCDYGYEYNTERDNVSHSEMIINHSTKEFLGWNETSSIVCHEDWERDGPPSAYNYTYEFYMSHSEFREYEDKTNDLATFDYDYSGMNKWFYIRDIPTIANESYLLRAWIDIPIGYDIYGKYWFAVKPSNLNIQQALANDMIYALDPWYNSDFLYCRNITLSNAGTSTLTNYPYYINITNTTDMNPDYSDLRFVNGSCGETALQLDHEIESYTTDNAEVWVRIPTLTSAGKTISLYYYNTSPVSDGQNPTGVWDDNYTMVQHLQETTGDHYDSTQYGNNATNSLSVQDAEGLVDGANNFDGGNELVEVPYDTTVDISSLNSLTIEAFVNPDTYTGLGYPQVFTQGEDFVLTFGFAEQDGTNGLMESWIDDNNQALGNTVVPTGTWSYVSMAMNTSGRYFYLNGTADGTGSYANPTDTTDDLGIGNTNPFWKDGGYEGNIDEVRISNVVRTTDWINQTYQAVFFQDDYVNFSGVETAPPDNTFPLINFTMPPTPPNDTTTTNTSVEINISIVEENLNEFIWNWNGTNYTILNETTALFLNLNNVSSLGEDETFVVDLSPYDNDGSVSGGASVNTTDCPFGNCLTFDGINDMITIPDKPELSGNKNITVMAWFNKYTEYGGGGATPVPIVCKYLSASEKDYCLGIVEHKISFKYETKANNWDAVGPNGVGTTIIQNNVWYYGAFTYDNSTREVKVYLDGVQEGNYTLLANETIPDTAQQLEIGRSGYKEDYWNGSIDEVRIYHRTLTPEEIYISYVSNLNKYDTDKWAFYINQSQNATDGLANGTYTYFGWVNDDNHNINMTETWEITIGEEAVFNDTCTYTSGNWDIDCSDNCSITSPVNMGGNDIVISGVGSFRTSVDIYNWGDLLIKGQDSNNKCHVYCISGGCFT